MLPFHEVCPICKSEFKQFKNIAKKCPMLNLDSFSFIEWRCGNDKFTQTTDLYKNLLLELITIENTIIEINYVLHKSVIYYGKKEIIELKNRLLVPDYPDLIKMHNTVRTIIVFS